MRVHAALSLTIAVLLVGVSIALVPPVPGVLIAYGRYASTWEGKSDIVYSKEGMSSSVAVADFANGTRTFHVAGKIQASSVARDMRLQRLLGHLSTLIPESPRSVLVIGCGAGITAGAASIDPAVDRVTIVEIEPLVPKTASDYFSAENFAVIRSDKTQIRIDDGRHFLMTTTERFDAITVDPLDPWVKGAAHLYTREFLEAARQHLNPGGVMTLYVQLFETSDEAVRSEVATFFEVFPNGSVWGNTYKGRGYDMILLGQTKPLHVDLDRAEQRFNTVASSLREVEIYNVVDLFATYAGRRADLGGWLNGAAINRDRNLRLQYLAGLALDRDDSVSIYDGMSKFRKFPEDAFTGSEATRDRLRRALTR